MRSLLSLLIAPSLVIWAGCSGGGGSTYAAGGAAGNSTGGTSSGSGGSSSGGSSSGGSSSGGSSSGGSSGKGGTSSSGGSAGKGGTSSSSGGTSSSGGNPGPSCTLLCMKIEQLACPSDDPETCNPDCLSSAEFIYTLTPNCVAQWDAYMACVAALPITELTCDADGFAEYPLTACPDEDAAMTACASAG